MQIFVSYSRCDSRWVDEKSPHGLIPQLARALRREGVEFWVDTPKLVGGDPWQRRIELAIDESAIALLLLDEDFFSSDFIQNVELPRIRQRQARGKMAVIPVWTKWCRWTEDAYITSLLVLPSGTSKPLIEYIHDDARWDRIRHEILSHLLVHLRVPQMPALTARPEPVAGKIAAVDNPQFRLRGEFSRADPHVVVTATLFGQEEIEDRYAWINGQLTQEFDWSPQRARTALFVINELVSNAFEHGCQGIGDREVQLELSHTSGGKRLVITVSDHGPGFSLHEVLQRGDILDSDSPRGRGLSIVRLLAVRLIPDSSGRRIQAVLRGDAADVSCLPGKRSPFVRGGEALPKLGVIAADEYREIGVQVVEDGPVCIARLHGLKIVDKDTIDRIRQELFDLSDQCQYLILDMSDAVFVSSGLLGVLTGLLKRCSAHSVGFCTVGVSPELHEVFAVTRLYQVIPVFESVAAALAATRCHRDTQETKRRLDE